MNIAKIGDEIRIIGDCSHDNASWGSHAQKIGSIHTVIDIQDSGVRINSRGLEWGIAECDYKLVTSSRKSTKKEIAVPPKKGMTVFDKGCNNEGKIIMFDDKTCVYEEASGRREHKSWDRIEVRIPVRPEEKVKKVKRKKKGGK